MPMIHTKMANDFTFKIGRYYIGSNFFICRKFSKVFYADADKIVNEMMIFILFIIEPIKGHCPKSHVLSNPFYLLHVCVHEIGPFYIYFYFHFKQKIYIPKIKLTG